MSGCLPGNRQASAVYWSINHHELRSQGSLQNQKTEISGSLHSAVQENPPVICQGAILADVQVDHKTRVRETNQHYPTVLGFVVSHD